MPESPRCAEVALRVASTAIVLCTVVGATPTAPRAAQDGPDEVKVLVRADTDWTSTKLRVVAGDTIRARAQGTINLGALGSCGPAGKRAADPNRLMLDRATGGLIAVVGDENDAFIFVGEESEFVAPYDGPLFLGVNEGNLRDNTGAFAVHVVVRRRRAAAAEPA